jgi:hypothetical protein
MATTTKILTNQFLAEIKVSQTEYEAMQEIADAYALDNIDAVINTILHRSITAELDIALPGGPKADRLRARLNAEWKQVFEEAE